MINIPDLPLDGKIVFKNKNFMLTWNGHNDPEFYIVKTLISDNATITSWSLYKDCITNKKESELLKEHGIQYWCSSSVINKYSLEVKPCLIIEQTLKEYISHIVFDPITLKPKEGRLFRRFSKEKGHEELCNKSTS